MGRNYEWTNERTYERKDENYIPLGINARGIINFSLQFIMKLTENALPLAPVAEVVECPLRETGGHGFDPGPRHTKVVNTLWYGAIFIERLISLIHM